MALPTELLNKLIKTVEKYKGVSIPIEPSDDIELLKLLGFSELEARQIKEELIKARIAKEESCQG